VSLWLNSGVPATEVARRAGHGGAVLLRIYALRYFTLNGTDHRSHKAQASMIRRYIIWRNQHAADEHLRRIVAKANVA
jgi:hypothetical protein